ncbi:serine acetyltransferase [Vibrio celticus]|uniref:serine acetyltransferase n=1 Tax=Vibrio celticus TaxID=446372 RepID=UPI004068130F
MLETIIEDFRLNSLQSFIVLLRYRLINKTKKFKIIQVILKLLFHVLYVLLNINCKISHNAKIGRRLKLLHQGDGVVISGQAEIYDDVTIYHQVTIGVNEKYKYEKQLTIQKNTILCAGSKVISCVVGDGAVIGPNVVVFKDVMDNSKIYKSQE